MEKIVAYSNPMQT